MQKLEEEVSGNHTVSHTPKDTHTMFSSSSPLHASDGLLNRQAMTLPFLLLHSMPPGQSCAWLHEEASPGYLPIKVRGSENCHRFSLGGICPIPGHEFQSVLFLLMLHLSSLPCRFQVPASDMKMTD